MRFRLRLNALDRRIVPATLTVDDNRAERPNAQFTSIQDAVEASAAGDTVLVFPGTYAEQVYVGQGKSNLTLRSQTEGAAIVRLPADAPDFSAMVTIDSATGVVFRGFTVSGPGGRAGQIYSGIEVNHRASVTLRNNLITDIGDPTASGLQTGIAVYVGYDGGGQATLINNTLSRYQKNGLVVDGPNSLAVVDNNTFVGSGPTGLIAQNGIQVSAGGSATITRNTITGHAYTGDAGPDPANPVSATGVVVFQAGQVNVTNNQLLSNQTGVYVQDQSATVTIQRNTVAGSFLDGITLDLARGGTVVSKNTVAGSGRDGIHVQSASSFNSILNNTVTGSGRYGIAVVPTRFGDNLTAEVAPTQNTIGGNRVSGSAAFDLFERSAFWDAGGMAVNNFWRGNTFGTKNRPNLG